MKHYLLPFLLSFTFSYASEIEKKSDSPFVNSDEICEYTKVDGRKIAIWVPEVERSLELLKPVPQKIKEAKENPAKFFKEDAEKAIASFEKFGREFRKCAATKKGAEKAKCLNNKNLDYCFGLGTTGNCNISLHSKFMSSCTNFKECLTLDEWRFELFSECFNPNNEMAVMFSIYDKDAKRRNYHVIRTGFFEYKKTAGLDQIACDFTVFNNESFHLTRALDTFTLNRPDEVILDPKMSLERWKESEEKLEAIKAGLQSK